MSSRTIDGVKVGAIVGGIIAVAVCAREVAMSAMYSAFSTEGLSGDALTETIHRDGLVRGAITGLIAAALVMALVVSPWWPPQKNDRAIAGAIAAVAFLNAMFFVSGLSLIVAALALGGLFSLGTSRLLPYEATVGDRLGVSLGAIAAMAVCTFVPAFLIGRGAVGGAAAAFIGTLIAARPMLWVLLRKNATASGGAAPVGGFVSPPRGWGWGRLHAREQRIKGFGYFYVDPVGGPSFHVLADAAAPLDPAALHAAHYRGTHTVRLNGFETLYLTGHGDEAKFAEFEQGGVLGTVFLPMTPAELAAVRLPAMPPWAHVYAGQPTAAAAA